MSMSLRFRAMDLWLLGLYLLALPCDIGDRPVFALTGGRVSGHTLKHAITALAAFGALFYLRRRQAVCIDPVRQA